MLSLGILHLLFQIRQMGRLLSYGGLSTADRSGGAGPSGGLVELLSGIFYANGVALSASGDFVLVVETLGLRVLRLWLEGPRAGQVETFVFNRQPKTRSQTERKLTVSIVIVGSVKRITAQHTFAGDQTRHQWHIIGMNEPAAVFRPARHQSVLGKRDHKKDRQGRTRED
jgi:hypothetical protein